MKIGKKKILAVEVAGNSIYAALAAKKGKGFEIIVKWLNGVMVKWQVNGVRVKLKILN